MKVITRVKHYARVIHTFFRRYERLLIAASLLTGFLFDNWWLSSVDVLWNDLVLGSYLILSAACILAFHYFQKHPLGGWRENLLDSFLPIIIQFSFGNLFSGLIIFYSRSADVAASWLFVAVLLGLIIFSEAFGKNYRRLRYQLTIWFFLVLAFSAFFVPVVLRVIGPLIFLLSIAVSGVLMYGLFWLLHRILPERAAAIRGFVVRMVLGIVAVYVIFYAMNWIPPLPLALKDAVIAHSVARVGDVYRVSAEQAPWWQWYSGYSKELHYTQGSTIYAYASVFAPTDLTVNTQHEWQYYNENLGQWQTKSTVSFAVHGGRHGGYRGYSTYSLLVPGQWRVNVKTDYGALIGRIQFTAIPVDSQVETVAEEY